MEEIARAVGLSRQSIYKKFGSKEACYTWALKTYMEKVKASTEIGAQYFMNRR